VTAAWSRHGTLDPQRFADRFFGLSAGNPAAMKLFAAALGARFAASHADPREASEKISDAMQIVGLDRWPRFLADMHERAGDPVAVVAAQSSLPVAASGHPEHDSGTSGPPPMPRDSRTEQNATDLARLMVTEAGGTTTAAMTAVGWTVHNHMVRNGRSDVSDVWSAYRHGKGATPDALRTPEWKWICRITRSSPPGCWPFCG